MPSLISCWWQTKVIVGVSDVGRNFGTAFYPPSNTVGFYGMIHEDGDNDAIGGNDDERAIKWSQNSWLKYYGSGGEIEFSEELKELLPNEAGKYLMRDRRLEGDEEKLDDVLFELESSHDELVTPYDATARNGRNKRPFVSGGEPKYPQELFSAVDLLSLQFLVSMVFFGRISPNRFLSSILLVMVIIVVVVIVMVIWVVIFVDVIVGVVIVVAIIGVVVFVTIIGIVVVGGGVPSIIKLSFVIIESEAGAYCIQTRTRHHQLKFIMLVFVVVVLVVVVIEIVEVVIVVVFGIVVVVACAFRAEEMPSLISCQIAAKVMAGVSDVDVLLGGILLTKDNTYGMIHGDGDNDTNDGDDDERVR
ncbi:hypothetical protein Tco_0782670 [Tanacetum coccineum]